MTYKPWFGTGSSFTDVPVDPEVRITIALDAPRAGGWARSYMQAVAGYFLGMTSGAIGDAGFFWWSVAVGAVGLVLLSAWISRVRS